MAQSRNYGNKLEGIQQNKQQSDYIMNYQSIYNREDFTLTEVVDMEKQIQRLKILFEFFDIWEGGLVYREQKEEELQEKIRLSEQVSFDQYEDDQRGYQQSGRNSYRQQRINPENELEIIKNKEKLLTEREKQLGEFEQDLMALRQEIVRKNMIIEREFEEIERQKQRLTEEDKFNGSYSKDYKIDENKWNISQQEFEIYQQQEDNLESRFASMNEKELLAEQEEMELLRLQKEIEDSKQQINDKKKELNQIRNEMTAKQQQLLQELDEAQKKLEMVTISVDCVQNQQPSSFYKEKLETREKRISEIEQKLAVKEEMLLKEIHQIKTKCAQLQIPTDNLKLIDESLSTRRCKTDSFSEINNSNLLLPKSNLSFKNYNNQNTPFSLVQTPPNARNMSSSQFQQTQTQFQIKRQSSEYSRSREQQRYSKYSQNDESCPEIKLIRENSQQERDRSPVLDLKMKLSSRKKELSAFLSPVHQQVRKFDATFNGSIEELDTTKGEVHQSYQNGYEIFNAHSHKQNELRSSTTASNLKINQNKSSIDSLSPGNRNTLATQKSSQYQLNKTLGNQINLKNNTIQINLHNQSLNGSQPTHGRNNSESMQAKILQQMKLNKQSLSSSKNSLNQQNQFSNGVTQSDIKSSARSQQQISHKINLPQQIQPDEPKNRVSQMTNSQKIKNKILKFTPNQLQEEEQCFPTKEESLIEEKDKLSNFSFKRNDNAHASQASINSLNKNEKQQQNQSNHQRTFSFANVGNSQEMTSGSAISSQQSVNNLFNFKNSSINGTTSYLKSSNKLNINNSITSEKRNSQRDENYDPRNQNQSSSYKLKLSLSNNNNNSTQMYN